jgi:hypothetical protein
MALDIIIKECDPVRMLEREGKFILCKEKNEGENILAFYARHLDFECTQHAHIADTYGIAHERVLGGGIIDIRLNGHHYEVSLSDYSVKFGAVPADLTPALVSALRVHFDRFDYEDAERQWYDEKYKKRIAAWEKDCEEIRAANERLKIYQGRARLLRAHESKRFVNRLKAWWHHCTIDEYVTQKYQEELAVLHEEPKECPPRPSYQFTPTLSADRFVILQPELDIFYHQVRRDKWQHYL